MRIIFEKSARSLTITDMPEELIRLTHAGCYEITPERVVYLFQMEELVEELVKDAQAMPIDAAANLFFLRISKLLEVAP